MKKKGNKFLFFILLFFIFCFFLQNHTIGEKNFYSDEKEGFGEICEELFYSVCRTKIGREIFQMTEEEAIEVFGNFAGEEVFV